VFFQLLLSHFIIDIPHFKVQTFEPVVLLPFKRRELLLFG